MATGTSRNISIWVVTANGMGLARRIQSQWAGATIRCSRRLAPEPTTSPVRPFKALIQAVAEDFHAADGHIFIMATGIVVRAIAPWRKHKTVDPAVVVVDDQGQYAISLLAGHIGGANALADSVAQMLGAKAVITTATDVNAKPSIDVIATRLRLTIENPQCIKTVNMALLSGTTLQLHDPYGLITKTLGPSQYGALSRDLTSEVSTGAGVYVDDKGKPKSPQVLVLRPPSLMAGIGCNRNTPEEEIRRLLEEVFDTHGLSLHCLAIIASIDIKNDEPGLLGMGRTLQVPMRFFSREELNQVHQVPNPSAMVAKHVGVPSVCEAAAILAARQGSLIVPKQKSKNVTLAIARHSSLSSASVPEA